MAGFYSATRQHYAAAHLPIFAPAPTAIAVSSLMKPMRARHVTTFPQPARPPVLSPPLWYTEHLDCSPVVGVFSFASRDAQNS